MAKIDTGLACLVQIARHFSIPADYHQLERAYIVDERGADSVTLLQATKDIGLKTRQFDGVTVEHLIKMPLPAVCRMKQGNYCVVIGGNEKEVLFYDPLRPQGRLLIKYGDFEKVWSGEAILFTKRFHVEKLTDKVDGFGFSWFIPVVAKYKNFLLKVLGISCITNMATGIAKKAHSHEAVLEKARQSGERLCALIEAVTGSIQHG